MNRNTSETQENIRRKLELLPDSPGCYLMKQDGEILYVGKAVSLQSRVRSYFREQDQTPKVASLVERIDDFDTILCSSNLEALMLECNLIKLHKPFYNILLKDDKHYPYIRINVMEPFPKLEIARHADADGARYFGPYVGTGAIRQTMALLRRMFPMRTCSLKLPSARPLRPCVNYEIGLCRAPCAHKITPEEYAQMTDGVIAFLKGRYKPVVQKLEEEMKAASLAMQYERAGELRDTIHDVHGLMEQQNVLRVDVGEQDIIAVAQDGLDAMAQVLFIRGGKMIGGDAYALPREGNEPADEVLTAFLLQFYEDRVPAREVLVQAVTDQETTELWLRGRREGAVTLLVPQRGEKRELVENSLRNAQDALRKRNARDQIMHERTVGAAEELAQALGLSMLPRRIEGFDISNTQGHQSVASMVVFTNGAPDKKAYRRFRIKTVEGANDFASMHEVLSRRFRRVNAQQPLDRWPLPDLVLVDGGPEQLRFAREAMLAEGFDVPMFGLAKRREEIWLPDKDAPVVLDRHSPALHLVERIRDEAHRFAITHHRGLRGKAAVRSRLEEIPGIGPARRRALLAAFRTMKGVSEATLDELAAVKGMSRPAAEALYAALHPPVPPEMAQPPLEA